MATIAEVKKAFQDARASIADLDQKLAAERKKIKVTAFRAGRPLTAAEIARRKEIAATRLELAEALQVLALKTIRSLEIAEDVDDLIREIGAVNQQLEDDLARLGEVASHAATAARVVEGLAKLAAKLAELRPSLI